MWRSYLKVRAACYLKTSQRWMGGPSSHLKQIKGLVRKAHLTLPLEHPKVRLAAIEEANNRLEACLRASDMEHMPPCDRASCRNSPESFWCNTPIAFPPRSWQTVFNARGKSMRELDANRSRIRRVRKFVLPEDVMIYQPGSRKRTDDGVCKLVLSMMDKVLAIDMQWNQPDSKVGILQVASSTFALLVRGPKYWDRGFQEGLISLFQDPSVLTVGYDFTEIEDQKLHNSFGFGVENFSNFVDLQVLAGKCGYPSDVSLSTLTKVVLGVESHVEPSMEDVDWEQERLKSSEAFFASLSVFAIGQIFRQLRHWHALPKRCSSCKQEMGIWLDQQMSCLHESCNESFTRLDQHQQHCLETQHPYQSQLCKGCHRILPPSSQAVVEADEVSDLKVKEVDRGDPVVTRVLRNRKVQHKKLIKTKYKETLLHLSGNQLSQSLYGCISNYSSSSS